MSESRGGRGWRWKSFRGRVGAERGQGGRRGRGLQAGGCLPRRHVSRLRRDCGASVPCRPQARVGTSRSCRWAAAVETILPRRLELLRASGEVALEDLVHRHAVRAGRADTASRGALLTEVPGAPAVSTERYPEPEAEREWRAVVVTGTNADEPSSASRVLMLRDAVELSPRVTSRDELPNSGLHQTGERA